MLPPHCTADYSRDHDRAVALCRCTLLYGEEAPVLPADAVATAQLPLGLGRGLRVAASGARVAYTGPSGRMLSLRCPPPMRRRRAPARLAACDERALETHLFHLHPASRALLLSQAGPHSGRALTVLPTSAAVALPPEHLRVLLPAPAPAAPPDTARVPLPKPPRPARRPPLGLQRPVS